MMRTNLALRMALLCILLIAHLSPSEGQTKPQPAVVNLPSGPISQIPSPNGKWNLVFECQNDCRERKLWVEEPISHNRRLVKEYDRSLGVSWAPDSHFFFVNDESGSTDTRCFVYEATTLREIDLEKLILAKDAGASEFLRAGHSYLRTKHWIGSRQLLVTLEGHNDGARPRAFNLRYRVALTGNVVKLSQQVEP